MRAVYNWVLQRQQITTVTAAYTVSETIRHVRVNATGGAITVTIPAAATRDGRPIRVTKTDSSANAVTIARTGSDTFNGATSISLATQYYSVELISNGNSAWDVQVAPSTFTQANVVGAASSTDNAVARFDGTGGKTIQNSAFVVDDTGHVTSFGGNIAFPAVQVSSAGANVLDDYEEGTWTPTIAGSTTAGSQTYSVQVGRYVKIGLWVNVGASIALTNKDVASAGDLRVNGLPFTCENVTSHGYMLTNYCGAIDLNVAGSYYTPQVIVQPNQTFCNMYETGDNVAIAALTVADFGNTSSVVLSGGYRASA